MNVALPTKPPPRPAGANPTTAMRPPPPEADQVPAEFGPPLVEKPSFELLGEEYARLGRHAEAAA